MPVSGRVHYIEAIPPPAERPRGTLLLIHAFPLNARMWEPQLALAAHGWRVVAPHLRGFDDDPSARPVSTIDDYAADVIDLLDGLKIQEAVLGGLSIGGYISFAIMRRAPQYVRALILADTRPQADTPEGLEARRRMLQLVKEKGTPAVVEEMLPKLVGRSTLEAHGDVVDRVRALGLSSGSDAIAGAIRALMSRPDSTALLRTIRCPTLIVVGDEDTLTPPSHSEEMHHAIAGSELAVIPRAGHLSSLEQPAAFNEALAAFLTHRV